MTRFPCSINKRVWATWSTFVPSHRRLKLPTKAFCKEHLLQDRLWWQLCGACLVKNLRAQGHCGGDSGVHTPFPYASGSSSIEALPSSRFQISISLLFSFYPTFPILLISNSPVLLHHEHTKCLLLMNFLFVSPNWTGCHKVSVLVDFILYSASHTSMMPSRCSARHPKSPVTFKRIGP